MNTQSNRLNTMRQRRHKKHDPAVPYMSILQCLDAIVMHGKHSNALNYCVNYAKHGIEICNKHEKDVSITQLDAIGVEADKYYNEMHTQLLYVLNNMTHWRGETATNVRVNLRGHIKALEQWKKEH